MVLEMLSLEVSINNFITVPVAIDERLTGKIVSGFLAQLIQGKSIDTCIKCGIWAATQIVQRSGCTYEGKPNFQS